MTTTYTRVRDAILKAIPELVTHCKECQAAEIKSHIGCTYPDINLEIVLKALKRKGSKYPICNISVSEDGSFLFDRYIDTETGREWVYTDNHGMHHTWILGEPLPRQTPDTIAFIDKMLYPH